MGICGFKCRYLDEIGECEVMGGECIGDLCESWEGETPAATREIATVNGICRLTW